MAQHLEVVDLDPSSRVWTALRTEAQAVAHDEPSLASLVNAVILSHSDLASALSYQLARKLGDQELRAMSLREVAHEAYAADPSIVANAEADLQAVYERDPACKGYIQPFLHFKGFQSLQTHRVAHWLWRRGRESLAFYLQSRMSELFQVDIHPAAVIGAGAFFDHGTGIVIGETARVGRDVSMLHGVTLGEPAPSGATAIPRSAMAFSWGPAPRCWGTSPSATTPRSPPDRWCSSRFPPAAPPPAFPPAWCAAPPVRSRRGPWTIRSRPRSWASERALAVASGAAAQ